MRIISGILILVTLVLNIRHGWAGVSMTPEAAGMMTQLGTDKRLGMVIGVLTLLGGLLVLFPPTFFVGCCLNAGIILLIMALALRAGNIKMALIEVPFLLMPLVLIWLGHPFKR